MSDVHYRPLDERRWSLSGSQLVTVDVAQLSGYYVIISPEVVNSLGGTPSSTIAASTIEGSALKQSVFDPAQPAADFLATAWANRGWTTEVEAFKLEIRSWVLNNLDNSTINPGNNPFNFYLLDSIISGNRYLVPVVYLGNDGEILGSIPVAPRAAIVGNGGSLALTSNDELYGIGGNNYLIFGPYTFTQGAYRITASHTGGTTICVMDPNSYAWAWGTGPVGNNTAGNFSSPVSVVGGRQWLMVGAGNTFAWGIDPNSYAWAWGTNSTTGRLGDGTTLDRSSPVSVVGGRQWRLLEAGRGNTSYMLGLDLNSYAWGWGTNIAGQLGNLSTAYASSPISVVGGRQWLSISASSSNVVGIDSNSNVYAWGSNVGGGLGNNSTVNVSSPVSVLGGILARSAMAFTAGAIVLDLNSYAWAWGQNSSSGNLNLGAVGDGTTVDRSSPVSVLGGRQWLAIATHNSPAALDSNSYAWGWGSGTYSVGDNTTLSRSSPVSVVGGHQFSYISGTNGIVAQKGNYLWGWGFNGASAILGSGTTEHKSSPVSIGLTPVNYSSPVVLNFPAFVAVDSTGQNAVALDSNSYAWAWGRNTSGAVGDNSIINRSSPVSVLGGRLFKKVLVPSGITASGPLNCVAMDISGYLWGWGHNNFTAGNGALGDNTGSNRSSPVSVLGGRKFIDYVNGGGVVLALDESSYAWSWGYNASGQIGNITVTHVNSPVSVFGARQWKKIAAGLFSSFGIDSNGYAWGWGTDPGDNSANQASSPVSVVGGIVFRDIAAGVTATVALDMNSYAWSWGSNGSGQCGDNTTINRSSPVSVVGGYQFDRVQGRGSTFMGVIGQSVYLWGDARLGALGLNDTNNRSSPTYAPLVRALFGN